MFGKKKIGIDAALHDRLAKAAGLAGYASTEEFVAHVLEREVDRIFGEGDGDAATTPEEEEAIRRRLEGLGYLG